jgi:D-tyrosyl-tRNA(Tyr) deacylase
VEIAGEVVGETRRGILLLLGIEATDSTTQSQKLIDKVLNYRIFPDNDGRMNLSVKDINGGVLIVSQFTLVADTRKGLRPGFSSAAAPEVAEKIYNEFVSSFKLVHPDVATGIFSADMQVSLCNDGPVTFLLES